MSERRRRSVSRHGVQNEKRYGIRFAFFARERLEHHAQPVGLRAQAAILRQERFSGRDSRC